MADYISAFKSGFSLLKRKDYDGYDRLSFVHSIGWLFGFVVAIAAKAYVGDPIDCFSYQEFNDQWVKYTDNYCFISNTYYIPMHKDLPGPDETIDKTKAELQYYQWVPLIMVLQILLFLIPWIVWEGAMSASGYDVQSIVKATSGTDCLDPENRKKSYKYLVNQMSRITQFYRPVSDSRIRFGLVHGRFLLWAHMLVKILCIINAIGQIYILGLFFGSEYKDFGYRYLSTFVTNNNWAPSEMFPRVTMCDMSIRGMGVNTRHYTIQCSIAINMFTEKIFLFIWWWLIFVAILSVIGLIQLILKSFWPNSKYKFVERYLQKIPPHRDENPADLEEFSDNYLRQDGVFIFRLILLNTNDVTTSEILYKLWKKWNKDIKGASSSAWPGEGQPLIHKSTTD